MNMPWIPPGNMPDGAINFLMCSGGIVFSFGGVWLLFSSPVGRFTVLGCLLAGVGGAALHHWWRYR
jgi:hypothetical protein